MFALSFDISTLLGLDQPARSADQVAKRRDHRDGHSDESLARRLRLSEHDIQEDLRLHGSVQHIADVAVAGPRT